MNPLLLLLTLLSNFSTFHNDNICFPESSRIESLHLASTSSFESEGSSKERNICITLESVLELSNNHVGEDWIHYLLVKDQKIQKGDTLILKLKKRAPLTIEAHSIEEDLDYTDSGKASIDFIYSDLIAIEKNRFELDVTVVENGGQYAGNLAKWKFFFKIKRA